MKTAVVSQKGWIVIPRETRDRYGMHPGTKVAIVDYGGTISLVPLSGDPIQAMRGFLKGGPSLTLELLDEHLRESERDEAKLRRLRGDHE